MAAGKTAEGFIVPPHKRERSSAGSIAAPCIAAAAAPQGSLYVAVL